MDKTGSDNRQEEQQDQGKPPGKQIEGSPERDKLRQLMLFYVDESGTGLGDKASPYFLLAAIAIPADQWRLVDHEVSTLKQRLISWAKPEDFEIKGRDIRRGEKFFTRQDWQTRVAAFHQVAQLISELPCRILAVQVDKRELPEFVSSHDMLYRLSLTRLLDQIDAELAAAECHGMLMFDMRSDLHSSVQDRRLVDAYRDWVAGRKGETRLIELPWFGFSAFYAGLQLADFSAYLIDFVANEGSPARGSSELMEACSRFKHKVRLLQIP